MDENQKYKLDKLTDYLKFMSTAHLAVIGVIGTFSEKFIGDKDISIEFWVTIAVLLISFLVSTYGYVTLINSFYEQPKHHKKIVTFARKYTGYVLIAAVYSFFFQVAVK
jgi:predicted Na+-dependent transporter